MTTYLRPGVYINESLQTLVNSPLANSTDAIPTFVGTIAKGGPVGPTLITSWAQYTSLYGDIKGTVSDDLPFAVYNYFANGGNQCYIVRAINSNAVAASLTLNNTVTPTAGAAMVVTALAAGAWASAGNDTIYITVNQNTVSSRFDLIVEVGQGATLVAREQFVNLTLDPADPRNAVNVINSPTIGSQYIKVTSSATSPFATNMNPASVTAVPLTGGSDGTGTPDLYAATQLLAALPNTLLLINLPGVSSSTVLTNVINWAAGTGTAFVVVDAPKPASGNLNSDVTSAATTLAAALPVSSYAAIYATWLWQTDPSSSVPGSLRLTAPGGSVLGQYVRTDVSRGVEKSPAGTGATVLTNQTYCTFTSAQLDALNAAGVNVIRQIPGAGFCIMGARTLNLGQADMYINVRRTLMYLKKNLLNLTQFAVFENNDASLWSVVQSQITQFLTSFWLAGGLNGDTAADAFYVVCDSTNNTPSSINAGVLNVSVGVALETPAEFIVINLGQYTGGTTNVTDSLAPAVATVSNA